MLISICQLLEIVCQIRVTAAYQTSPTNRLSRLPTSKSPQALNFVQTPPTLPIWANQAHHVPSWRPLPPHHPWSGVTHVVDLLFPIGPEPGGSSLDRQFPCWGMIWLCRAAWAAGRVGKNYLASGVSGFFLFCVCNSLCAFFCLTTPYTASSNTRQTDKTPPKCLSHH